ncbi:hypothetical protein FBUS_11448, partial [Fasciolopsis buskii]
VTTSFSQIRIYKLPELRRYSGSISSTAFVFDVCVILLVILVPILLAHYSYEFYIEEYTYAETPDVSFSEDWLLFLQTAENNFYSSSKPWNIVQSSYVTPLTSYSTMTKGIKLRIEVPVTHTSEIQSIMLMVAFNVEFYSYTRMKAYLPTMITLNVPVQSSELELIGEFLVRQSDTLPTIGQYQMAKRDHEDQEMSSSQALLQYFSFSSSPVYGEMETKLVEWKPPNPSSPRFTVSATINYGASRLVVRPGFWYTLKFAWIQYLSTALIFIYFAEKIREFVYSRKLVSTHVSSTLSKIHKNEL